MATLILTAVGSAIGGPLGGAVGAILGQRIDQAIFAPKARHGPRLGDLAVQTSSYGTEIPKIFGTMRAAGSVIWATDLIESRSSSSGGKGRPKTISYSYSVSFAVALSGRPIRSVRRIWADGKLLRGAAGDFKTATDYRLHLGDEDQPVDPLIASALGAGQTSAFRGMAYALFENFQLEEYGNRIPSLTFEIEADDGPVAIGTIAQILSNGAIEPSETPLLGGYAASGDSVRSAVEGLADALPLSLFEQNGVLRFGELASGSLAIEMDEAIEHPEITRRALATLPGEVSFSYYDIARDYQTGLQRVSLHGAPVQRVDRRSLAAAMDAGAAKAFAERRMQSLLAARTNAKLTLGWPRIDLRPADRIMLAGEPGSWRIRRWTLGRASLTLDLVRAGAGPVDSVEASPGAAVGQSDLRHGPTTLRLLDLPLGEPMGSRPLLSVAAAGIEPGWRRAALIASFDSGANWSDAGSTAPAAVMGNALTAMGTGQSALLDLVSTVEIELINDAMWLEDADEEMLAAGANLAAIGNELVQFGRAEWLGDRQFRLGRLLRGRRGTEWAATGHEAGEAFTLVEPESLVVIEAPAGMIGGTADLMASGIGDAEPVAVSTALTGESLRPPSPVHLSIEEAAGGDILIRWVRRSRLGWSWPSGIDTPLGEESEAYRLVLAGIGFERSVIVNTPSYIYDAAQQAADGYAGALHILVSQLGTHAVSHAAMMTFE